MKKFIKSLVIFGLIAFLSIFLFLKDKILPVSNTAQIEVDTALGSEKVLTVEFQDKELNQETSISDKEHYSFTTQEKGILFSVTPNKSGIITLTLKNPNTKEVIQYNSLIIDGKKGFTIPQVVNTDLPYDYSFIAKGNKKYDIEIQWEVI